MISNATKFLEESRKESLLRCAGSTSICESPKHVKNNVYVYVYMCVCVRACVYLYII